IQEFDIFDSQIFNIGETGCCMDRYPESGDGISMFCDEEFNSVAKTSADNDAPVDTTSSSSTTGDGKSSDYSLRKRMGGLAANKAGLQSVDREKGTAFFENEARKDEALNVKIDKMLKKYEFLKKDDLSSDLVKIDRIIHELERDRDLSHIIVHVDMDAFYASVEERDNPSLRGKPMAVGDTSMLSTANYEARKFGVRSAMPGFIAKRLCPNLILVPLHFEKYRTVSMQVRKVFAQYDPNFTPMSLDEAYLDVTEYIQKTGRSPDEVVQQIRDEIFSKTRLTASAGIAANKLLAKVCSDINKPNGQYRIQNNLDCIMEFIRNLPARKVSGIGRVTERILDALEIKTLGDIFQKRVYIYKIFTLNSFQFLIRASLGLGSTVVKSDHNRKSMSVERTFAPLSRPEDLLAKLRELADHLSADLKKEDLSVSRQHTLHGKTVTLKFKSISYGVTNRAKTIPRYIHKADDLFYFGKQILEAELPLNLRLMGLRLSTLRSSEVETMNGVKRFFSVQERESVDPPVKKSTVTPIIEHQSTSSEPEYMDSSGNEGNRYANYLDVKENVPFRDESVEDVELRCKETSEQPITNITKERCKENISVLDSDDNTRLNTNWDCP
ncbi:14982_t:CDS:10, partial [Acaulospora morrowiae]